MNQLNSWSSFRRPTGLSTLSAARETEMSRQDDESSVEDPATQWAMWVSNLPETTQRILTDPASDREPMYRELIATRRISFGAILLELFAIEALSWRGAESG